MSFNREMDKEDVVYISNRMLLSQKKKKNTNNKIMPFAATWTDLEIIILSEASQGQKDKYDIAYMWNLKRRVQMNLQKRSRITDVEKTVGYKEDKGWKG